MKCIIYLCVIFSIAAFVCGGSRPQEEFFGEDYVDVDYPRLTSPYSADLGSVSNYESDFEYKPPKESRIWFGQRNDGKKRNNDRDPTETNDIASGDRDLLALLFRPENSARRIAFIRKQQRRLENSRKFYDDSLVRKKREANPDPWGSRPKRTHCNKCGGGGGGGGYDNYGGYGGAQQAIPVYAVAVPVYSDFGGHGGGYGGGYGGGGHVKKPSYGGGGYGGGHGGQGGYVQKPFYGGGGKGCSVCSGSPGLVGNPGGFGGHGGGSYSQSWSQSSSSSNSWGYGKK